MALWATVSWDFPVPLALTVAAFVWLYCLWLVILAVSASRGDKKIGGVSLGRGIVESTNDRSDETVKIEFFKGESTHRLTISTLEGSGIEKGDEWVFASVTGEIIRMLKIDTSEPGRITSQGRQYGTDAFGPASEDPGAMFTRDQLNNQALFATLLPGTWGAGVTGVMAMEAWGWSGWASSPFFALAGVSFILFFVVMVIEHNFASIAQLVLDIGYVQEAKIWKQEVSEGGEVTNQDIVIADTAPPRSVNERRHYAYDKPYEIDRGDLVILAIDHNGHISRLLNES